MRRNKALDRPVFVVGCGRSGTTILGNLLGQHPKLAYLNEPRDIWATAPTTDIWSDAATRRNGELRLTSADATPETASSITREFILATHKQRAKRLVEKLPINSFRIDFINAIFPDALFIHLIRNGIEVARSIERVAPTFNWYGHNDYKWDLLGNYAGAMGLKDLTNLCGDNNFLRGLLEWRLSIDAAQTSLRILPAERQLEIRYDQLLGDPEQICSRLDNFIDLQPDRKMHTFATNNITRQTAAIDKSAITPTMHKIAGETLSRLGYV